MSGFRRLATCEVDETALAGFVLLGVSTFDHVLTEAECVDPEIAPFFFHREAREKGLEAQYLAIERRFVTLLDRLAEGGVSLIHRPARLCPLRLGSARYRALVRRSLRERATNDFYFPALGARWVFGHDLTHWIILPDAARKGEIATFAQAAGLHIHVTEGVCDEG